MFSALSLPLHCQWFPLPSSLQKYDGYISSGLSTSLERAPRQLGPGTLQFCSPLCWSLKHFTTGGEQGKGSSGCRVEAGSMMLCLAGLGTGPCLNPEPSFLDSSPPQRPGPPQYFSGYSFTPRVETTCISLT